MMQMLAVGATVTEVGPWVPWLCKYTSNLPLLVMSMCVPILTDCFAFYRQRDEWMPR